MYKIFIAASWDDRVNVQVLSRLCKELSGLITTEDWWLHLNPNLHKDYAQADLKGIQECDIFILFNTHKITPGKLIELGMAIALKKPILVIGIKIMSVFRTMITRQESFFNMEHAAHLIEIFYKEMMLR